jgi:serine/threonine protein kinase
MAVDAGLVAPTRRRVGRYEIIRQIGRGGMAIVYLARQTTLDRDVALKELSSFHASTPEAGERFVRESQLAGSLNHPNIVTVYEYFEEDGVPYIAMEHVPRGSLRQYVGHLTLAQLAGVMEGLLAGLAHAEAYGIVHRDLKPENLMVTGDGRIKIADFGIAKTTQTTGAGSFVTLAGTAVGTPMYIAPEQAMGLEIGLWSDLYSVGVMAWEHLVGRAPFPEGEAPMVTLTRQVSEEIRPATDVNPDADEEVSQWIERLLVKDPAERTRSPGDAWEDLEEIIIARLGPRWRRDARLPSQSTIRDAPRPLTPAPFESHQARVPRAAADAPRSAPAQEVSADGYITYGQPPQQAVPPEPVAQPWPEAPLSVEEPIGAEELRPEVQSEPPEIEEPVPAIEEPVEPPPPMEATEAPEALALSEPTPATPQRTRVRPTPRPLRRPAHEPSGHATTSVRTALLISTALAAAAVVGFVLAPSSSGSASSASRLIGRASAGPISVLVPAGWTRRATAAAPHLALRNQIVLAQRRPAGGAGGTLVLGVATTTDPSLLPADLRAALPSAPSRQQVTLESARFFRYLDLTPEGADAPETVYAAPTTAGTVIGACLLRGAAPGFPSDCERVIGSLHLNRGSLLGLGPNRHLAAELSRSLTALNVALSQSGGQLGRARTPSAQSQLAGAIADAYGRAAATLDGLRPVPTAAAATAALASSLRTTGAAFTTLSHAAAHNDRRGYEAARETIRSDAAAISAALQQFVRLGYSLD